MRAPGRLRTKFTAFTMGAPYWLPESPIFGLKRPEPRGLTDGGTSAAADVA